MSLNFQEALNHYQLGHIDQAVRVLEALAGENAAGEEAKHLLAVCYYRQGRFAQAEPLFAELTTRQPLKEDIWQYWGLALERLGRFEEASRAFKQVAKLRGSGPAPRGARSVESSDADAYRMAEGDAESDDEAASNREIRSFSDLILSQPGPQSKAIAQLMQETTIDRRAMLTAYLVDLFLVSLLYASFPVAVMLVMADQSFSPRGLSNEMDVALAMFAPLLAAAFVIAALQVKCQRFIIRDGYVRVRRGLIFKRAENLELYKVTDLSLRQSPFSFLTGSGEIVLTAGDSKAKIRGICRGRGLDDMYEKLRLLVNMLRTTSLTKGLFQ